MRIALIFLAFAGGSMLVSWLLHFIRVRWIKYIPGVLMGLLAIASVLQAKLEIFGDNDGMADLAAIVAAMLFGTMAIAGIVTCIVLDKIKPRSA
jgi:branched-subunit amino acid transport protein